MMQQFLVPGVQNTEEADLGVEVLGVSGNLDESLGATAEQQRVNHFLVLESERRQFVGQSEVHVGIVRRQEFGAARRQPAVACLALAFRAVPVAAGIVGDGSMAAVGTLIEMATHGGSAASCDRDEHFNVQPGEPGRMPVDESLSRGPYDIVQLQDWPAHFIRSGSQTLPALV